MTTNQNSTPYANAIRRLTTVVIMGIAPLLITVGTATAAHADTTVSTPDPSFHSPARRTGLHPARRRTTTTSTTAVDSAKPPPRASSAAATAAACEGAAGPQRKAH